MRTSLAILLAGSLLPALACAGCSRESAAEPTPAGGRVAGRVTVTGSSTMAPLVGEIAKRFEARHPDARIDVQTGGSSRGIADATRGTADIGMSSRDLAASERERLVTSTLARDGIGFIVHADNPVPGLTTDQARDILAGRIDDWSRVGGRPGPITLINRADGRSELSLVTGHFGLDAADIAADLIAGENQQGIKLVASDPGATTYLSIGTSEYEIAAGTPIRLLALDGQAAASATVAEGTYPIGRPLILVTRSDLTPVARAFLDFALSSDVDDLVLEQSFVPLPR